MSNEDFNGILIKKSTFKDVKIIEKLIDKQAKKLPWWVSGPPGTGKTRGFIRKKYEKFLDEGVVLGKDSYFISHGKCCW
tara:strand:+ start:446 stop:682 length:237 start_codon:yes stop_codon:yes gene_type:complete